MAVETVFFLISTAVAVEKFKMVNRGEEPSILLWIHVIYISTDGYVNFIKVNYKNFKNVSPFSDL